MQTACRPDTMNRKMWATMRRQMRIALLAGATLAGGVLPLYGQDRPAEPKGKAKKVKLFDGKTLKGWKIPKVFDFERHGKVEVADQAILLHEGAPMTGVAYTGKPPRMNYELTLEGRRVSGDDFFCGITFPVAQSYCSLILGGWGGTVTGLSNVDGYSASENETSGYQEFERGRWYHIRLRVTTKKIEVWLDKEQIIDLVTKGHKFDIWWEQEPMRPLGFATWHTTGALRKIELRSVQE